MTTYSVIELVKEVRLAMDMNQTDSTLTGFNDTETLDLDQLIKGKLEAGARIVETEAPVWLLDSGKELTGNITISDATLGDYGRKKLPADFMRLVTFKMSHWRRAVTEAISETHPMYALQSSKFPGVRGSADKPVVAIVSLPTGLELEFRAANGGTVERAQYLPYPKINGSQIELCPKLKDAIVMMTAYLVCQTLGENERAQGMLTQAQELMK